MTKVQVLAVAAVLSVTSAAEAQPSALRQHYSFDGQRIVAELSVPYADLDLASPQGARTLLQRIEAAADAVCAGDAALPTGRDCRETAVARAVAQMRNPALARLAAGTRTRNLGR